MLPLNMELDEKIDLAAKWIYESNNLVIFTGAGILTLLQITVRLFKTEFRKPTLWDLLFACFLLAIGLGDKVSWAWPLILIIVGFIILRSALKKK